MQKSYSKGHKIQAIEVVGQKSCDSTTFSYSRKNVGLIRDTFLLPE